MVSIKNLKFSYFIKYNKEVFNVIDKFSYNFGNGITTLLGPSGCGKSTLLKIIGDLIEPGVGIIDGTILIDGFTPSEVRLKNGYGIAFQHPVLLPWLNVVKNITLTQSSRYTNNEKKANEILKLIRMDGKERLFPHELSGGMLQRVNLARALFHGPKLLLLDEPFGALDAFNRYSIMSDLYDIHKDVGSTIILITHDLLEASIFSDYVILFSGPPLKILCIYDASQYKRPGIKDKIIDITDIELARKILKDIQLEKHKVDKQ